MFCKKCGSKVSDGAKFCNSCGARVTEEPLTTNNEVVTKKTADGNSENQVTQGGTSENNTATSGPGTTGANNNGQNNPNIYDTQSYAQAKKKSGGKSKFAIAGGLIVALLIIAYLVFGGETESDKYINIVKDGYLLEYKDDNVSCGDVFDYFFSEGEWKYYGSGDDNMVEYSGECRYNDENVEAVITFKINKDEDGFTAQKATIDDEKYDVVTLLETAYDDYLDNKK